MQILPPVHFAKFSAIPSMAKLLIGSGKVRREQKLYALYCHHAERGGDSTSHAAEGRRKKFDNKMFLSLALLSGKTCANGIALSR